MIAHFKNKSLEYRDFLALNKENKGSVLKDGNKCGIVNSGYSEHKKQVSAFPEITMFREKRLSLKKGKRRAQDVIDQLA